MYIFLFVQQNPDDSISDASNNFEMDLNQSQQVALFCVSFLSLVSSGISMPGGLLSQALLLAKSAGRKRAQIWKEGRGTEAQQH